jgi:nicotinate-nucleotide pyrophosphorylase (carboxylating)
MQQLPPYVTEKALRTFIEQALEEDIGPGDYSSLASIDKEAQGIANLVIKDHGVLAGVLVAEQVFRAVDNQLQVQIFIEDGASVRPGDLVLSVNGSAQSILSAERLVLNIMQRMSGIATKTFNLTQLIEGTSARLLDTRKTTPNFRMFEKWAVNIGGGKNHRFALYDLIMLKDNHNDFAGGIGAAVARTKLFLKEHQLDLKIEVETRTLPEVTEAVEAGADIILLDNMNPVMISEALSIIDGRVETEASGGIDEANILDMAKTGVDFISVGALTHSYKSLDMSLKAVNA